MKRLLWLVFLLAVLGSSAFADEGYQNFCQKGGVTVVTQGLNSATKVQGSSPQCLVTVYLTGTTTKASIFSNNTGTVKPNPFQAQTDGTFLFYAADGRYDVTICAKNVANPTVCGTDAVLPSPYTFTDVLLCDPATCGGGGGGTTPHNLLSTTHPDTAPYTPPVQGDLIQGAGTNLWTRLPGNTTAVPQWLRSLGNGSANSTQGWVTRGNPCPTGQFGKELTTDLVLNCDSPSLPNGLTLPPPVAVPNGQAVAWAFPTSVRCGAAGFNQFQTNGYAVCGISNAILNMTQSCGLCNHTWISEWSNFVMPALPNDAVIQNVYGVEFGSKGLNGDVTAVYFASCGTGNFNNNNTNGPFNGEFHTPSLGSTSGTVTAAVCSSEIDASLALTFNDTTTINAMGIAIYYTTATPTGQTGFYFPFPGTAGAGSVTSFSAGSLTPLFDTSVLNPTTTPNLTFALRTFAAHTFFGNNTGSTATPAASAITVADLPIQPSGTTTKYATMSGSVATGNCVIGDALGNVIDGGTCGLVPASPSAWDSGVNYAKNTVVLYNGSSFYSLVANVGITPGSDPATWSLLAAAGINGTSGTNGTNGAPGAPGYSPNQILSGCGVVWGSGLTFNISPCSYLIQNTQYSTAQTSSTLSAADPSLDRIDIIAVNSASNVVVIAGTPSATPTPPVVDIATQLQLTFVYVAAGATIPSNITVTDIYHENTEWTCATSGGAVNCASTNNPRTGTKDVEWTNAATGAFERHTIPSGTMDLSTRNNFVFWIRSKATWAATRSLTIQWFNGSTAKCSPVSLKDGNFTFNSSNVTTYQQIVIPTATFACAGIPVTRVQFTEAGSGANLGFYVDDIILQGGVTSSVSSGGLNPRGTWSATTAYSVNDWVQSNGASWYALASNTGSAPTPTNPNWQGILASSPFTSQGTNPALTGTVRLPNGEKVSWRNAGNTADCSIYLDSNNVWNFDGCGAPATELNMQTELSASATTPSAGFSTFYVDTTTGFPCAKDSGGTAHCATGGGGTVTNVSGTSPISSSGGATPAISCPTCAIGPGSSTANHVAKFSGTDGLTLADGGAIPAGTVTSIATTSPLGGGTITGTGTLTCTTCVVASSPGAGVAHFAGSTQTVTSSAIVGGDMTNNTVTSTQEAVVNTRRACSIPVGDGTNTVVSGDYSPFKVASCKVPYAATIVEIDLQSDAGTPSVLLERRRGAATLADLLSGALPAAGTTPTCATSVISTTCIDGTTSSGSITLSNTSLNAGDVIEVKSGTGSTETSTRITIVWTVN